MKLQHKEQWKEIAGFSDYMISDLGRVFNQRIDRIMRTSQNNYGLVKITLVMDETRERHTKSVALLVAEAFVEAPDAKSRTLVQLDGGLNNVVATNLVWRPRGFAWKYARQLKEEQPLYYQNLPVFDSVHNVEYASIIVAGMHQGLLFDDIWRSTYSRVAIYPTRAVFEIVGASLTSQ